MTYRGVKLPKCNGRPQLWLRGANDMGYPPHTSARIIYPNGDVHYTTYAEPAGAWYVFGCTSSSTQELAIENSIDYDLDNSFGETVLPIFIGYL